MPFRLPARRGATRDHVPALVVAAVVVVNAWLLRSELDPVHYLHDGSFHQAYLGWATDRLRAGDSPLDGIFTPLGLGFPLFQHYQVLPYLLTAPFAAVFGVQDTYVTVLYLLLVLWPACVYAAVRLLEFDRWAAAGAAVVAPWVMSAPGYGFELGSYVWRGSGMWTQAWGMWFFALALATAWRAIFRGRSRALAAALLAATLTSHVLSGLLALAVVVAWGVLALAGPSPRWSRALRAGAVAGVGVLASAWLLVPSVIDREATYFSNPPGTTWSDSFGVGQVLSWLWRGELFDRGRWPVLTVLAAIGLGVVARRALRREADDNARALLVLCAVSLVLFFGASVVGPVVDRLPGREALFLHRMIVGVHFGGVVLAGVGAAATARVLFRAAVGLVVRARVRVPVPVTAGAVSVVAVGALAVAGLAPAWTQVRSYLGEQERWIDEQRAADSGDGRDFATLAGIAAAGGGRVSAGTRGTTGDSYKVGYVPAYIELLDLGLDGIGFTGRVPALTEPSEARYTGEAAGQSEAFDVRWHLRPRDAAGPPGGRVVAARGRHVLWQVDTTGPVAMIDTTAALRADRADVALASAAFFNSTMPLEGRYPVLALDGATPAPPTLVGPAPVPGRPGTAAGVRAADDGQSYAATTSASRDAALLVKVSYHPRWVAEVDGRPARTVPVAPGLLAVEVPAGDHRVTVRFAGFPLGWRMALAAAGAAGIVALWLADTGRLRGLLRVRWPSRWPSPWSARPGAQETPGRRPVLTPVRDPPPGEPGSAA